MPDGRYLDLSFEQGQAPEVLFNTTLIGREGGQSLQNLVADAVEACEVDCRKILS